MMIKQYLIMCYVSKEVLSFNFEMQADIYLKIYLELSYLVHNGKHEHFFQKLSKYGWDSLYCSRGQ